MFCSILIPNFPNYDSVWRNPAKGDLKFIDFSEEHHPESKVRWLYVEGTLGLSHPATTANYSNPKDLAAAEDLGVVGSGQPGKMLDRTCIHVSLRGQ